MAESGKLTGAGKMAESGKLTGAGKMAEFGKMPHWPVRVAGMMTGKLTESMTVKAPLLSEN